ncbi:DUF4163 domain-containing protein [Heliobacterium gestii]|uniref:DUF4163 domain-containing protein n=1 Tax=Heliomicrobium gestii TaxID=2699 RepID=A0A845LEQ1_HELGE|nr:stalk domain-containing protein [Heliomicrobium gestii]MBM7867591.1 inhibitor of cysteine peptidase [Heliomicrobium gestii]MZP43864.1 DUF4163 domain-containing protein [Heliomicrobium gestii]
MPFSMKEPFLLAVAALFWLATTTTACASHGDTLDIILDGKSMPYSGLLLEESALVPLNAISDSLGAEPTWTPSDQTVCLKKADRTITMKMNEYKATVNDHQLSLDTPPQLIGHNVYVPLRFVAENLAASVSMDPATKTVALNRLKENAITIKTAKESSETKEMIINIQYPQFAGMQDPAVQEGINRKIQEQVAQFKQKTLTDAKEMRESFLDSNVPLRTFSIICNYAVKYNANNLVSLYFIDSNYLGGAHGMSYASSLTFDITDGKVYELPDLFSSPAYIERINQRIEQLKGSDYFLWTPFTSIDPKQAYYLSPNGLVVYYQLYDIAPYAAGFPQFTIPYAELADLLTVPIR